MLVLNQTLIADTALLVLSARGKYLGTKLGLLAGHRRRVRARGRLAADPPPRPPILQSGVCLLGFVFQFAPGEGWG